MQSILVTGLPKSGKRSLLNIIPDLSSSEKRIGALSYTEYTDGQINLLLFEYDIVNLCILFRAKIVSNY